ncbi:stathmin-2-B isoform X2 [Parasteatoda tepidariorum]|uniref:stathmin-2-B isoform X2 n=1 Tax=Parasteatoda tepidariorum TaxID=114398 RepID=UPI00077FC356|nr:stathmin domain-containing protein 1 isoform X2 [Parasteatoda tepidariorum]
MDLRRNTKQNQESIKSSTSQISTKSNTSWDSGMYELDDEYSHIITENSDPSKVQEVNSQFIPRDGIELLIQGKACPRKLSSRDREKMAQQAVIETLKDEGLVIRPGSRAVGGIRFDFVPAENTLSKSSSSCPKLPPINIRKKYKRKKAELTYEEIEQKLIKAEERRKKKLEEKLSKLNLKDRQELQATLEQQTEINRQKIEEKLTTTLKSREKHFIELRDKLKAREEHARKVRERKQMQESGFKYIMPP